MKQKIVTTGDRVNFNGSLYEIVSEHYHNGHTFFVVKIDRAARKNEYVFTASRFDGFMGMFNSFDAALNIASKNKRTNEVFIVVPMKSEIKNPPNDEPDVEVTYFDVYQGKLVVE